MQPNNGPVKLITQYNHLGIAGVIDHERFNLIAIDHHSTRIEGSTLTEIETQVLINEGRTPNGKPLEESLMVTDHHAALVFTLKNAKAKKELTVFLLQQINVLVMKNTGKVITPCWVRLIPVQVLLEKAMLPRAYLIFQFLIGLKASPTTR